MTAPPKICRFPFCNAVAPRPYFTGRRRDWCDEHRRVVTVLDARRRKQAYLRRQAAS